MRYHLLIWMVLVAGSALAQGQIREVFMCKDATLRIRAASAGAVRYQWFMNNQLITGSSSPELQVSQEGTYKAQGVNADGCESGESVYVVVKHNKPSAIDDIATGKVNTELLIDVLKNDLSECAVLDNAALEIVSGPASGTALCTNGKLSYTPPRDFEGLVTVQYKVRD